MFLNAKVLQIGLQYGECKLQSYKE
jgi:hypothetical protein